MDAESNPPAERSSIDALIRAGFRRESDQDADAVRQLADRIRQATSVHLVGDGTADPARLLSSDDFERYTISGEIGRGGVGEVLRGRDRTLERNVAIKVLSSRHAERPDMVNRFIEEAQIGGQLQHPGIVPVHDVGYRDDGRPFFTMKLVEGSTLAELLQSRPDPTDQRRRFLSIFEKVCQTMAFAHARGVVHRDLKPANIMVGAYGEVQVMDWGMAKVLDREPEPAAPTEVTTVRTHGNESTSETGSVMGTPAYMPPEQALGEVESIDARADVFALGAILCEVLTGDPPYTGNVDEVRKQARLADLADARARLTNATPDTTLRQLAFDMLSRALVDRPTDAGVVADRFNQYRSAIDSMARNAELRAARARARLIVASVVAAASLLVAGLLLWQQHERRVRAERVEREVDDAVDDLNRTLRTARAAAATNLAAWPDVEASAKRLGALARATDVSADSAARARTLVDQSLHEARRVKRERVARARDRQTVRRLESIVASKDPFDLASQRAALEAVYREYGIDVDVPGEAAEKINASSIKQALVEHLYLWFAATMNQASPRQADLLRVLGLTDDDPLRQRLRTFVATRDGDGFRQFVETIDLSEAPLATIRITALSFTGLGDPAGGTKLLRRALDHHPGDPTLTARFARFLEIAEPDAKDELYRAYWAVRAMRPASAEAWVGTARWKLANGDPQGAERDARRAVALDPQCAVAQRKLADVLFETGRRDEAIDVARASLRQERDAFIHNWFARMLHMSGHDGAEDELEAAVRLDPAHVPSWVRLGQLRTKRGDRAGALDAYRAILRIGDHTAFRRPDLHRIHQSVGYDARHALSVAHFEVGEDERDRGRIDVAIGHYRAAAARSDNPLIRGKLAMVLLHTDQFDEASRLSRSLIEERPDFPLAYMTLAQIFESRGDYDGAIKHYRAAADACKKRGMPYPRLLQDYLLTKARHVRAVGSLPIARERPTTYAALARRAIIHDDHGHRKAAAEDWEAAVERFGSKLDPDKLSSAARAAVRYATATGDGAPVDAERTRWLALGLDWLADAVDAYLDDAANAPGQLTSIRYQVGCIRARHAFRAIRDNADRLPPALQEKARTLWRDVDEWLAKP